MNLDLHLRKAQSLLRDSAYSIFDIAIRTGFHGFIRGLSASIALPFNGAVKTALLRIPFSPQAFISCCLISIKQQSQPAQEDEADWF
jgi:hypothetical protein